MANGSLVKVVPESGQVEDNISLGRFSNPGVGRYLAPSKDGETLFALVPGEQDGPSRVAVVDIATFQVRDRYQLENGVVFRSLVVGPNTDHLYLFGNRQGREVEDPAGNYREGSVVVTILDPRDGRILESQTVREAEGKDWAVYRGGVSPGEDQLFVSYHGADTDGADWITVGLDRCQTEALAGQGCIPAPGSGTWASKATIS